ncbi:hypothetical protein NEOLEDRAFT_1143222 [Neolentinus lepideus HHB14362 ss-1]|uniref:Uncharacterized protein n=1 Tax=Neolentinus lepideus HHB14362 ss-1 TaxID=1314782 RepID=A0A165MNZ2_9AGAM|nr:hypothetical protein NEOLEDRAFT_1143222 [Neolentinus lepideus HHB14362 ss-1]
MNRTETRFGRSSSQTAYWVMTRTSSSLGRRTRMGITLLLGRSTAYSDTRVLRRSLGHVRLLLFYLVAAADLIGQSRWKRTSTSIARWYPTSATRTWGTHRLMTRHPI